MSSIDKYIKESIAIFNLQKEVFCKTLSEGENTPSFSVRSLSEIEKGNAKTIGLEHLENLLTSFLMFDISEEVHLLQILDKISDMSALNDDDCDLQSLLLNPVLDQLPKEAVALLSEVDEFALNFRAPYYNVLLLFLILSKKCLFPELNDINNLNASDLQKICETDLETLVFEESEKDPHSTFTDEEIRQLAKIGQKVLRQFVSSEGGVRKYAKSMTRVKRWLNLFGNVGAIVERIKEMSSKIDSSLLRKYELLDKEFEDIVDYLISSEQIKKISNEIDKGSKYIESVDLSSALQIVYWLGITYSYYFIMLRTSNFLKYSPDELLKTLNKYPIKTAKIENDIFDIANIRDKNERELMQTKLVLPYIIGKGGLLWWEYNYDCRYHSVLARHIVENFINNSIKIPLKNS